MFPGVSLGAGGGGFSGSSAASSETGAVNFGAFTFQPKGGGMPTAAWIAIAAVAGVILVMLLRGR